MTTKAKKKKPLTTAQINAAMAREYVEYLLTQHDVKRDLFAALAAAGSAYGADHASEVVAVRAYDIADAMMKRRTITRL